MCPLTIVLSFDKALPLTKPLHADAVYDRRRLLLLECLVQLRGQRSRGGEGERGNGGGVSGRDEREKRCVKGWGGEMEGGRGGNEKTCNEDQRIDRSCKLNQFSVSFARFKDSLTTHCNNGLISWK